jgi:flagellar protein FlaG
MKQQPEEEITTVSTADYRESYANSVQVRVTVWDFFLSFGTIKEIAPGKGEISNFQGVFLSPQQAKAMVNILTKELQGYERKLGEIRLLPSATGEVVQ